MQLSTAQQWTTSWNQRNPNMVKAFRIDRAEIEEILAITNVAYVRVYMGYDADENIDRKSVV